MVYAENYRPDISWYNLTGDDYTTYMYGYAQHYSEIWSPGTYHGVHYENNMVITLFFIVNCAQIDARRHTLFCSQMHV